jgi:hypothetical protein
MPSLSNDYFRFIWDGEILQLGINPYDFKPNELINERNFTTNHYLLSLYKGMGELSQENYSCYPVFNQAYFYVSTFFSKTIFYNVLFLRVLIIATIFIGFHFLEKILNEEKLERNKIFLLALNPLLITEVSQNLHFEGVMISFLIIAFYFLRYKSYSLKLVLGTFFFAVSVHVKLIPLILLPFLLRWLGWWKSIFVGLLVIIFSFLIGIILIREHNYLNFLQSIQLYFKQFEFNSFFLFWYIEYGRWHYGYNRIQTYGPYLSRLAIEFIILFAWIGDKFSFQKTMKRMLFGIVIYYFLSSTIHPWYILTPLLFSVFTNFRFVYLWSFLVLLSYLSYLNPGKYTFHVIVSFEYLLVISLMIYEAFVKEIKPWWKKQKITSE